MRSTIFTLFFLSLFSFLNAQFDHIPDLVTVDSDGNSFDLKADYLEQGKPVLIHFFATWNPWDKYVLDTGSLQQAYELYGSEGLDVLGIVGYEIDSSTHAEDLDGGGNAVMDFNEACNFPLINDDDPSWGLSGFGVFAMPSFALICPDGQVYVDSSLEPSFPHVQLPNPWNYGLLLTLSGVIDHFEIACDFDLPDDNISGYTTFDTENCDVILENAMLATKVTMDDGTDNPIITYSYTDGRYEYTLPNGTYDLTYEPILPIYAVCDQVDQVTIDNDTLMDINATFSALIDCPSMHVNILPWITRPCELNSYMAVSVCNAGPVAYVGGDLSVQMLPGAIILNTSPPVDYTFDDVSGVFTTTIGEMGSFDCSNFVVQYETPCGVEMGDSLCYNAFLDMSSIEASCAVFSQSTVEFCFEVIGSYDPNDKTGLTQGDGEFNYIDAGDELEYMIRFQNTGTDTAFTVRIEDELSAQFDINSIRPKMSSHDYSMSVEDGKLTFLFEDIKLVDSFANEPESHGFVTFAITLREELEPGEDIFNDAAIYFDGNDPIITNNFKYTIRVINDTENMTYHTLDISPNPVSDRAVITTDLTGDKMLSVMNSAGVRIDNGIIFSTNNYQLNMATYAQGIYFIQLTNEDGLKTEMQKVVKF